MQPGTLLLLNVPGGKVNPLTQTRVPRRLRMELEIVELDDEGLRVKTPGCYPPGGFRVSWEHWNAAWEPYTL